MPRWGSSRLGLLPALSRAASSTSLSSKVAWLHRVGADLQRRQPRTCDVGQEVTEPAPAPRTQHLLRRELERDGSSTANLISLLWCQIQFLHSIFFLERERDDAKESSGLSLGSRALQPYIADKGSISTRNFSVGGLCGCCIILCEFLLDTDFYTYLILIKPS